MDKAQFLQEKIAFSHTYPQQNDLAFYRFFTEKYPTEAVGWLHLGREWERRGEFEAALDAYQQAIRCEPDPFQEDAREAYHALLRAEKRRSRRQRLRRGIASLLLLLLGLLSLETPVGELLDDSALPAAAQPPAAQATGYRNHTEVIAIPASMSTEQAKQHIKRYLQAQRPSPTKPYTLLVVPQTSGTPLFTPLTFYRPAQIKGVLRYDPATQSMISQKWYPQSCQCDNDPTVAAARQIHRAEQQVVEQVLILRNALYHHYPEPPS